MKGPRELTFFSKQPVQPSSLFERIFENNFCEAVGLRMGTWAQPHERLFEDNVRLTS